VQLRKLQITGIEIQIGQVVMCFHVPRFVLQGESKTVKRFRHPALLEFDDAEVAVGIGEVVTFGLSLRGIVQQLWRRLARAAAVPSSNGLSKRAILA
jgi:hypothetical protein